MIPFCLQYQQQQAKFSRCITLTLFLLSHLWFFCLCLPLLVTCDYIWPNQIIQDSLPILRPIILILSARSHLPCNIAFLGLKPVAKNHRSKSYQIIYMPSLLKVDWFYWVFTSYIHLLCDLGLATSVFMQNLQSERPEHLEPPSEAAQGSLWHGTPLCLPFEFLPLQFLMAFGVSSLSPPVTNEVLRGCLCLVALTLWYCSIIYLFCLFILTKCINQVMKMYKVI